MKSQLTRGIMCGLTEIAETFGVGKARVRNWIKNGAPVYQDPATKKWLAHPDELWEWRKSHDMKKLSIPS